MCVQVCWWLTFILIDLSEALSDCNPLKQTRCIFPASTIIIADPDEDHNIFRTPYALLMKRCILILSLFCHIDDKLITPALKRTAIAIKRWWWSSGQRTKSSKPINCLCSIFRPPTIYPRPGWLNLKVYTRHLAREIHKNKLNLLTSDKPYYFILY